VDDTEREEMAKRHVEEYRKLKIKHAEEGSIWATGDLFEQWVAENLFPDEYFSIVDYTPQREDILGRRIETATTPDFIFRDKKTQKTFYIECEFRRQTINGKLTVCEQWKLHRYRKLIENDGMKMFFVVGLGGEPCDPEHIFCIDVDNMKWGSPYFSHYNFPKINVEFFISLDQIKEISSPASNIPRT